MSVDSRPHNLAGCRRRDGKGCHEGCLCHCHACRAPDWHTPAWSVQRSPAPLGYGRYGDDPSHVGCPRARSDMTPCVARDGAIACADDEACVGCGAHPADLLTELVRAVTEPAVSEPVRPARPRAVMGTDPE